MTKKDNFENLICFLYFINAFIILNNISAYLIRCRSQTISLGTLSPSNTIIMLYLLFFKWLF